MPNAASTGPMSAPAASSASARWTTVSQAMRLIQKPTVWSGPYQVKARLSGPRSSNSVSSSARAASKRSVGLPLRDSSSSSPGSLSSRMHWILWS